MARRLLLRAVLDGGVGARAARLVPHRERRQAVLPAVERLHSRQGGMPLQSLSATHWPSDLSSAPTTSMRERKRKQSLPIAHSHSLRSSILLSRLLRPKVSTNADFLPSRSVGAAANKVHHCKYAHRPNVLELLLLTALRCSALSDSRAEPVPSRALPSSPRLALRTSEWSGD